MAAKTPSYMYLWEYHIEPEHKAEFERVYGSDGEWVRLFRKAEGYLRTELFRDQIDANRYMTVDLWESAAAWTTFRERFAAEFEELNASCEKLTSAERELGRFELI